MAALTPSMLHYPVQLRYVRALCLQTEYRKCIQICRDLLRTADIQPHPIHTAFLLFYTALAHDEMARAMHHNSTAKVPALDSAEQFYLAALDALPSPEEAELLCAELVRKSWTDSFLESGEGSPSLGTFDHFDKASLLSSSLRLRRESFSVRSPVYSPSTITSDPDDFDDLESHDSFSELMTPNRVLNRECSRMSLLDTPPSGKRNSRKESALKTLPAPARMQRDFSRMSLIATPPRKPMSQGLLRPIRPGSLPKQFHIPPTLVNSSKIPLASNGKHALDESPCRGYRESVNFKRGSPQKQQHDSELVSPISRRDSGRYSSDASTTSAISPLTPSHSRHNSISSDSGNEEGLYLRFNDHLDSMRLQLETHITLVQRAREQLRDCQANRALEKAAASTNTSSIEPSDAVDGCIGNDQEPPPTSVLSRARSYWSFVPEDAKVADKQRRIRAGRERKWERKIARFDARKYQDLCERALDEL